TFFKEIRKWQSQYAYGKPPAEQENLILPCPIRDHHKDLYEILRSHPTIRPADEPAREAKENQRYHENLISYDQHLRKVIDPIWEREYKRCA
ncbi:MAG: radical SAM protein, partial [Thermodesulfobacteriota bacterium]